MNKKHLIIFVSIGIFLLTGCPMSPYARQQLFQKEWKVVKYRLNGMSDKDIDNYFRECISGGKIFFYAGGFRNELLVDKSDFELAKQFQSFNLACTGGVEQGHKFNKFMIDYIKKNKIYSNYEKR
jgi:hypothetical protein